MANKDLTVYCGRCGMRLPIDGDKRTVRCHHCESMQEIVAEMNYVKGFAAGFSACAEAMRDRLEDNLEQSTYILNQCLKRRDGGDD